MKTCRENYATNVVLYATLEGITMPIFSEAATFERQDHNPFCICDTILRARRSNQHRLMQPGLLWIYPRSSPAVHQEYTPRP
jgi:hypothetical protein